ncbi:hypothetical protein [Metabacillus litoralis]|uniref:hypothetical protein n=1 Tax=Metabacillus litoralis TaxID=152268 RepID=UPI000EF57207|nr:hypothetical protein [Metabacillus litoralis]
MDIEKMRTKLLHEVKQEMKKLASNRGLSGFKSMENDELEELLESNVEGFTLEDDQSSASITITWKHKGKATGITRTIDFIDNVILRDTF